MRIVIIVLVLIVIGFAVAIGVGVARGRSTPAPDDNHAPPTRNGEIDRDALEKWKPPSMAAFMGKAAAPFAPKLLKTPVELSSQVENELGGDKPVTLGVEVSKKDMRIARLKLTSGQAIMATYTCLPEDGQTCPQPVCLCAPGTSFDVGEVEACPRPWRDARTPKDSDRLLCKDDDSAVSLLVYPQGGVISIEPLAKQVATVSIR